MGWKKLQLPKCIHLMGVKKTAAAKNSVQEPSCRFIVGRKERDCEKAPSSFQLRTFIPFSYAHECRQSWTRVYPPQICQKWHQRETEKESARSQLAQIFLSSSWCRKIQMMLRWNGLLKEYSKSTGCRENASLPPSSSTDSAQGIIHTYFYPGTSSCPWGKKQRSPDWQKQKVNAEL